MRYLQEVVGLLFDISCTGWRHSIYLSKQV